MTDWSASQSKPRIFRCPNCGNSITEQPGDPVYQCDDCFATLQALHRRKNPATIQSGLEGNQLGGNLEFSRKDNSNVNPSVYSIAGPSSNIAGSSSGDGYRPLRSDMHNSRTRASQTPEREVLFRASPKVNDENNQGMRNELGGNSPASHIIERRQGAAFEVDRRYRVLEIESNDKSKLELDKGKKVFKEVEDRRYTKRDTNSTASLKLNRGSVEGDRRFEAFRGLNVDQMKGKKILDYSERGSSDFAMKSTYDSTEDHKDDLILNLDPMQLLKELDLLREHLIRSSPVYKQTASPAYHPQYITRVTKGSPLVDAVSAQPFFPLEKNICLSNFSSQTPGHADVGGSEVLHSQQAVETSHSLRKAGSYPTIGPLEDEMRTNSQRIANLSKDPVKLSSQVRDKETINRDKHPCRPITSAAPFVLCWSCFDLLRLPEKTRVSVNKQFKLRCGSCSQLLLLGHDGKRLVTSPPSPSMASAEAHNSSDYEANNHLHPQGQQNAKPITSDSDYDGSNSSIHSLEQNLASPPTARHEMLCKEPPKLNNDENMHMISDPDNRSKGFANTVGGRARTSSSSLLSDDEVVSEGDYSRNSTSQDPIDDIDQDGINEDRESYYAGSTTKKSNREFHLFHHSRKRSSPKVSVNGHSISDRLIKKAEKKAGPILSGEYWYDNRSGFWGVMGQQCLGIIPPFIEEFNYPMTKNCAGGKTEVFINGRELHQRDFDLLVSRGLPPATGQSYNLEISGKVFDAVSGAQLCIIGKLAPTVEKIGRGFGMQVPRY